MDTGKCLYQPYDKDSLTTVYKAINKLSRIEWFRDSVRDIRAFKVEDWSDFTDVVKGRLRFDAKILIIE